MGEMVKYNGNDSMWRKLEKYILEFGERFRANTRIYIDKVCKHLRWNKSQFYNAVTQLRKKSRYLRVNAKSIRPVRGKDPEKGNCYRILGHAEFVEYEIIKPAMMGAVRQSYAVESAYLARNTLPESDRIFADMFIVGGEASNEMTRGTLQTRKRLLEKHNDKQPD